MGPPSFHTSAAVPASWLGRAGFPLGPRSQGVMQGRGIGVGGESAVSSLLLGGQELRSQKPSLDSGLCSEGRRSLPDRLFWMCCAEGSIATAPLRELVVTVESPPRVGAKRSRFCSLPPKGFPIHNNSHSG